MSETNLLDEVSAMNLPQEVAAQGQGQPAGAEGAADAGECACTIWAVVNANGSLARGFRAVSSQRLVTGRYLVTFNRNVRDAAYTGTIGLSGAVGLPPVGQIAVVGAAASVNAVFVTTQNSLGAEVDQPFHLAVHCRP